MPFALIWVNHIGVDRLLGYGLKYSNGFGWTHLGIKGRHGWSFAWRLLGALTQPYA